MDRIERIGVRGPQWVRPELDPDREDIAERRREQERRRRERREPPPEQRDEGDEPPHRIDVIA